MGHLNTKGTLTLDGAEHTGRIVTHHGRLRVFAGKQTVFDEQVTDLDRISRNTWSFTLQDGQMGQIAGTGCGCGGGR